MSTELRTTNNPRPHAMTPARPASGGLATYSAEQRDLLKRTICVGATDDEFALFIGVCNRTGLDPFTRQIHAVKRWDSKMKREVMTVQVGIDGFRLIAERSGKLDGQEGPFWCGEDGVWKELWTDKAPPVAAKVTVFRKGMSRGFVGVANYRAFVQRTKEGNPTRFWANMPEHMLAKVAEAQALRKAFPQELSGVYEAAELGANAPLANGPLPGCISAQDWGLIRAALQANNTPQRELLDHLAVEHPREILAEDLADVLKLAKTPRDQWGKEPVEADEWGGDSPAEAPTEPGKATREQVQRLLAEFDRIGYTEAEEAALLKRYNATTPQELAPLTVETILVELRDLDSKREGG